MYVGVLYVDGCGYVEDGREIFDDDLDDDSIMSATSRKKERVGSKRQKDRRKESNQTCSDSAGRSSNIRSMLMNMPTKKKKEVRRS
jgi:DNA polymerase alpha subunit A